MLLLYFAVNRRLIINNYKLQPHIKPRICEISVYPVS